MTDAITAASGASQAAGTSGGSASGGIAGTFNTFLTLLTTQLKNQDPTKAMDTTEMTNQLVQFASVEQQIGMNTNLQKLIGLQKTTELTAAAPLMGKTVEVESDRLSLQGGSAGLRLPAAGAATTAHVTVLDAAGGALKEADVTLGTGTTDWSWDGRDSSGTKLADGAYRYAVAGRDAAGNLQTVTATVLARATATERLSSTQGGDLKLVLGGLTVGFDAVRSLAAQ